MKFKPGQRVRLIQEDFGFGASKGAEATVIWAPGCAPLSRDLWPPHSEHREAPSLRGPYSDAFLYVIWDELNPNWVSAGHGGFYLCRFEVMNDKPVIGVAYNVADRCSCGGPAVSVPCGISPAAKEIQVCQACGKEK